MKVNRKLRPSRFVLLIAAFLVLSLAIWGGTVIARLYGLSNQAVSIVTRSTDQEPATTDPIIETTLKVIEGTPSDLGTDYELGAVNATSDPIYQKNPIDSNVVNILLLSSDARVGETEGRSDSMLLLSYNRNVKTLKMMSFMRDSWVKIENHGWNRINAAFNYGGVGLAINTVNDNFSLDIQRYVTIRFEQFASIIDKLGGVELNLTKDEINHINKYTAGSRLNNTPGVKKLNGAQALTHCRDRYVGNGDFDRTRRQRETMLAVMQKVKLIKDPVALADLVNFALDHVETNMKGNEILKLMTEVLGIEGVSMTMSRIPFDQTWNYADKDGRSVIQIDLEKNRLLLKQFLYGG